MLLYTYMQVLMFINIPNSTSTAMSTQQKLLEYITKQSQLYQVTLTTSSRIAKALETQHKIKSHKTIPKQHRPPKLPTVFAAGNSELQDSFQVEYSKLFLDHLDKVIAHNTAVQETHKEKLQRIITQTEVHLADSTLPTHTIAAEHRKFRQQNNLKDHPTLPQLKRKLIDHGTSALDIPDHNPMDQEYMLDPADHAPGASPRTLDQVSVTSHKTTETNTSAQKGAMTHEVGMSGSGPESLCAVALPSEDNRRKRLKKTPHPPARKQTKLNHFLGLSTIDKIHRK